ncbi:MAG: hypothetical protein KJT01_09835 [Gemmatimonadetes bacterium]|nr:hypothetical protein [Gemmatimonadota bacterium]
MGFESAHTARRRLALVAAHRQEVQIALAGEVPARAPSSPLEELARDILDTPGAGSALLTAYASQARALALVLEAVQRSDGAPLPPTVVQAVRQAMTTLAPMPAIPLGLIRTAPPPPQSA